MKKTAVSEDRIASFEASLKELDEIVQTLERGDLKLEESLKLFERGMALNDECRKALENAELRVRQLNAPEDPA